MDRCSHIDYLALASLLSRSLVSLLEVESLDQYHIVLRKSLDDLARLAFVLPYKHFYIVSFLDVHVGNFK